MGTTISSHEPSRHLFLGIADGSEALANAQPGAEFVEALFALDFQFHPNGVAFDYFVPNADRIKVSLNGPYIYDSKFFLTKHLHQHVQLLRKVYTDLANECETWRRRKRFGAEDLHTLEKYVGLPLRVGPKTRDYIRVSVAAIREYFLKVHVGV